MAKTLLPKDQIPAVGVSQLRKFGGPVDLKITDKQTGFTDNFPMGLTVDDLFGAIVVLEEDLKSTKLFADVVYDLDGKVYFTLGTVHYAYDKTEGRVNVA